jgi:hypothetical protein
MRREFAWPKVDRRSHPRVEADIAGRLVTRTLSHEPVVVRGRNISCSGVYCHIDRYIAPFQKLHLSMIIPIRENGRVHNEVIQLEGVTVRVEPETEDPDVLDYHVAIFFENLSKEDRNLISTYVGQQKGN